MSQWHNLLYFSLKIESKTVVIFLLNVIFILEYNLSVGRKKLIEERNSERFKLLTPDDNELDVMFVDQRGKT